MSEIYSELWALSAFPGDPCVCVWVNGTMNAHWDTHIIFHWMPDTKHFALSKSIFTNSQYICGCACNKVTRLKWHLCREKWKLYKRSTLSSWHYALCLYQLQTKAKHYHNRGVIIVRYCSSNGMRRMENTILKQMITRTCRWFIGRYFIPAPFCCQVIFNGLQRAAYVC